MKIAFVVHDFHENVGHSRYVMELTKHFCAAHEVHIFANTFLSACALDVHFHYVPAWRVRALTSVYTFPLGLRTLDAALASLDIRHMQGYCGGQPNVVTAHICVASYLASLQSISWRTRLSLELMAFREAQFYRKYGGSIIAISQKVARELKECYQVRGPIYVIPHGVDTNRFNSMHRERFRSMVRTQIGIPEDQTVALYVGDLTKAHTHLKALAEAAPEIQILVVSRSQQYRWSKHNVRFLPPTDHIERYYAAADAFIFPTAYDAFGMVLLEALAAGLPVFSSDCAGAAEVISPGVDGFVSSLKNWVETTREGLRNQILLKAIGRAAEQSAKRYSWSVVARAVEQVYLDIAQSGNQATI